MPEELIINALHHAFRAQPPTPSLLVHADWGGQYCGRAYHKLLCDHEAVRSQSRHGDCYDKAQASGHACSNCASGPFLPCPTRRPA